MNQRFTFKLRKLKCGSLLLDKLAEEHSLFGQPLADHIIRQQILEFVPKD